MAFHSHLKENLALRGQWKQLGLCWGFPSAPSQLEPNELGLTFMRAVQWPIPGILKEPDPAEELERSVRAGTRSKRSPTPFRNWTMNAERGWAGGKEQVAGEPWNDCDNSLTTTDTHTHLPVFALGPLRRSCMETIQLCQDQSQMLPQGLAVSPKLHLLSGPLVLFAEDHYKFGVKVCLLMVLFDIPVHLIIICMHKCHLFLTQVWWLRSETSCCEWEVAYSASSALKHSLSSKTWN